MALNEKNYELINEFMEQVCRLASLNSPRLFMDALKGFTSDKGIGGDGWWVTTEFFEAATMTESDIEPDILKEFYPASAPLCQDLPYHHRILLLLTIHSPPCNNFCFSIIPYRHFL